MASRRDELTEFIGLTLVEAPPALEALDREVRDGYVRTLFAYVAPDRDRIEAFLFEPTERPPAGGVLALHQHNSEWSIGKSEIAGLVGDQMQAFGPALARRGVVVLAPDIIGFESRCVRAAGDASLPPPLAKPGSSVDGWLQYYNQMAHRLVTGDLLIRKMLQDAQLAVSWLRALIPTGAPIGAVGHSMGGTLALFSGALDSRIDFTCTSGAVGSYRHKLAHGIGLEMASVIPGFANRFDLDDVMRCVAPRALFVVSADHDFASEDTANVVEAVRDAFQRGNDNSLLTHLRVSGGHQLEQRRFEAIVDWVVTQCD